MNKSVLRLATVLLSGAAALLFSHCTRIDSRGNPTSPQPQHVQGTHVGSAAR